MNRRHRPVRDQRGVSLVLVLVTLVIFGLIVPVLGQFGSTNGVSGYVLKGQRFDRYAAEAGMQAAINWAQGQRQAGRQGTQCPAITTDSLNNNAGVNAQRSVRVECAGYNGHGLPEATASMPAYALMARGTDSQAVHVIGGGSARTEGPWWSEGGIKVDSATIDASADYIGAKRPCSGITGAPTDCPSTRTVDDPDPRINIPSTIPVDPIRNDPCSEVHNGVVTVQPGLHWDENFFDTIGDGKCSRGSDLTIRLADGGPHIFDFTFFGGSDALWRINPSPRNATVTVESADAPNCGGAAAGPVLFAGDFQMQIRPGATVDLCGVDESGQQIALAQVMHGQDPTPVQPEPTTTPSRWTTDDPHGRLDGFAESPPAPAGLLASVDCVPDRGGCAGNSVQGRLHGDRADGIVSMAVRDPVPAAIGAKIDHLHLSITHLEDNPGDVEQRHVWIDGLPERFECGLTDPNHDLGSANGWHTDGYDCELADQDTEWHPYFPNGNLTVNYEVELKDQRNGDNPPERTTNIGLDAVQLTAFYAEASARNSIPGSNKILTVDSGGVLRVGGMAYLPAGDTTFDFGGAANITFARGIVVKTVDVQNLPNDPTFAPFSLPGGGNYTDRLTTFRAFLGTDTTPVLTARVRFCDVHPEHGAATPPDCVGPDGSPAKILAWDPTR